MPIGKGKTQAEKDWEALDAPRLYKDVELKDFHNKIQKFCVDRTLSTGEVVKVLDWNEMAVAFGAFTRVVVGSNTYYMAGGGPEGNTKRSDALVNLWGQYQSYRIRKDMAQIHEEKALIDMSKDV